MLIAQLRSLYQPFAQKVLFFLPLQLQPTTVSGVFLFHKKAPTGCFGVDRIWEFTTLRTLLSSFDNKWFVVMLVTQQHAP